MCGISGICVLNGTPVQPKEISSQIETIVHRGPDEGAVYVSPHGQCGLGIRRLSIIDVAGGRQPLSNESDAVHLVYNGETYNYRSLRRELEQLGHRPKTHNDAEVVLHGYEAWGPAGVLPRLRGMAAFALWDDQQQQLFLARDRFGIKPLYYAEHQGRLYFASEIKAILSHPDFPRRVNVAALDTMLTLGFVPGPATMFEGIYRLPPAHFLIARNGAIQINRYWQIDYQANGHVSENEAAEQLLTLLEEAVRLRLMSEVPLGALLSGGLDSGTLVALIQAGLDCPDGAGDTPSTVFKAGHQLKTVSIGFEHPAYDEAPLARSLAQFIGTEHHSITFTARDFDDYPIVMRHLEEPQCAATAVPIYRLYQACRQAGLTVVLTGEGADELLGGYHWHKGDALLRPLLRLPGPLRRMLASAPGPMSTAARRVLVRGARDIPGRYRDWLEVGSQDDRPRVLSSEVRGHLSQNGSDPLLADWAEKLLGLQTTAPLHHMLWLETQTRMVDFINFEVDKMSMAHSIEARVPFLDHKLWEYCAGLPAHYKLKGRTAKYLLRLAAKDILPAATRQRRKKGLASPHADWLRSTTLPDWAEAALSPAAIKAAGLFSPTVVQDLHRAHQAGQPSLGPLLMGILSTQVWYECFMK
jgi:asparagine synthase (glutamine-hydrolysing)